MRSIGPTSFALAVIIVGGVFAIPTPAASALSAASTPATSVGWINISAVGDYGYSPANLQQVPTNSTITVTFTDKSQMAHSFTILGREGWVVPSNDTQSQIDQLAWGHSPPALENANVTGTGDTNVTTFQSPGPGWYEFVCTVAGHFQLGMYGFIAFGMNLPSNLTPPSRTGIGGNLNFSPLDAAILAGVLVVAVVLGVVLWRRRRARFEAPRRSR
jgi:plastocyanin